MQVQTDILDQSIVLKMHQINTNTNYFRRKIIAYNISAIILKFYYAILTVEFVIKVETDYIHNISPE